jgi:DNA-binding PadR family transcriptional regulator
MSEEAKATSRVPLRSPIYWALLGLLIERPSYGYELLKRFEREYDKLLPLSGDSHIYTALNALAGKGLIEEVHAPDIGERGPERQPKPRYRATAEGERCFLEWVIASRWEDRRQWRLFLRQLVVFASRPEVGIQIIERCEQSYLREAGDDSQAASDAGGCDRVAGLAARLLCEESRLTIAARLLWVDYARKEFTASPSSGSRIPSAPRCSKIEPSKPDLCAAGDTLYTEDVTEGKEHPPSPPGGKRPRPTAL